MADLRIADAPEIALEDITGNEKIPTGGYGNSAVTINNLGQFAKTALSLATEAYVSNAVGQKENKITLTGVNLTPSSTYSDVPQTNNMILNTIHQDLLNRMEWIKDNVSVITDHQALQNRGVTNTHPSTAISHNVTSNVSIELETIKNDILRIETETIPEVSNQIVGKQDVIVNDVNLSASSVLSNVPSTNNSALNSSLQALMNRDEFRSIHNNLSGRDIINAHPSTSISDGLETQKTINDLTVRRFDSIEDLISYNPRSNGQVIYVKNRKSTYVYDSTKSNINNNITIINGWVLVQEKPDAVSVWQAGFSLDGSNEGSKVQAVFDLGLQLYVPKGTTLSSSVFNQNKIYGEGTFYYLANSGTSQLSYSMPRTLQHTAANKRPQQFNIQCRSNWESASAVSYLVNQTDVDRPQLSGFQSKAQFIANGRFIDATGAYIGVRAKNHVNISNCVYTSTSVTSPDIVVGLDVVAGDCIGVVTSDTTWHIGWVSSVDFSANKINVHAWINTLTHVEETPTLTTCQVPFTNAIWGQNSNVYLDDDSPAFSAIGYELGLRDRRTGFTSRSDGFLAVNLDGTSNKRLGSAFINSGYWTSTVNSSNSTYGLYAQSTTKRAAHLEITTADQVGLNINQATSSNFVGKLIQATRGDTAEVSYYIDAYGRHSRLAQEYRLITSSGEHNALQPSMVMKSVAGAITTTINTVGMRTGHILEFKSFSADAWSIVAGGTTYTLQSNGTSDYLKLFYDGTNFLKLFLGKSL